MMTKSGLHISEAFRAFLLKCEVNRTMRKALADKEHFNRPHVQSAFQTGDVKAAWDLYKRESAPKTSTIYMELTDAEKVQLEMYVKENCLPF